ncbi:MAG: hybrid sensor histidine kinase/response regulator [Myxococcales bacterium]|nr:hybrid sensor histidine kinase/response regulator [Myxococcales bacterium]
MKDRVLVVDDSPQNRLVAVGHLEAAGYEVAGVGSGDEALSYLRANRTDLVILDVLMPGMGGFEVCKRIRANPQLAGIPVMFLTALGDREATQPALDAGGDDLLPKPFQRAELLLRVRSLIRQRHQAMELAAQNERLKKLEQDKRRITQLIVHDLKGPATALLANAELLKAGTLPAELADVVDDIEIAVGHLERTVKNLLDLSRADDVGLAVLLEPFDLRALVAESTGNLRGLARLHRVQVVPHVDADSVTGDRELLRRMLANLLHNAIRHSPPDSEVRVVASRDGSTVVLEVSDRGPGVTAEEAERIFDPYVSKTGAGHGLGLVFCRLAAEAHRGTIEVVPRAEGGATFRVRLPQP